MGPVSEFMRRAPVIVPPSISIGDWLDDYVYQTHFKMYPVVEDERLLGPRRRNLDDAGPARVGPQDLDLIRECGATLEHLSDLLMSHEG